MPNQYALVGDIGGTNARLALCEIQSGNISNTVSYSGADYDSLQTVIQDYCSTVEHKIKTACIAIACPVTGDWVSMTNHHWAFSINQLKEVLGFEVLEVINDFTAVSLAIPMLQTDDCFQIGGRAPQPNQPVSVFGAGTGLGVALLINSNHHWLSLPGEGGHVDLAPCTQEEDALIVHLRKQFGRVSAERCLSGQGLVNIYQFVVSQDGRTPNNFNPEEITRNALNGSCLDCHRTLQLFCVLMGRFGGNLALTSGAFGGVYIAGGIVPRFKEFFIDSGFRQAFEDKGRFKDYLKDIPIFLITHKEPGLLGAGTYLRQALNLAID